MFDYIVHCALIFLAESLSVDKQNVVFTYNKWNVFPPVKGGTHVTTWMNLEDIPHETHLETEDSTVPAPQELRA